MLLPNRCWLPVGMCVPPSRRDRKQRKGMTITTVIHLLFTLLFPSSNFHKLSFQHLLFKSRNQKENLTNNGISCSLEAPAEVKLRQPDWARNFHFRGRLRPTLLSPQRIIPRSIRRPDYADHIQGVSESEQRDKNNHNNIRVYTSEELDGEYGLRHACKMGREVLDCAGKALRVGVTTDEIDRVVHEACIERDCYPSPLNYYK